MQLHWVSLLPIVLLLKKGTRGLIYTKLIILVSLVGTSLIVLKRHFPPGAIVTTKRYKHFLYEKNDKMLIRVHFFNFHFSSYLFILFTSVTFSTKMDG